MAFVEQVAVQEKLLPTCRASLKLWPLAHLINFSFIPSTQRLLYINVISVSPQLPMPPHSEPFRSSWAFEMLWSPRVAAPACLNSRERELLKNRQHRHKCVQIFWTMLLSQASTSEGVKAEAVASSPPGLVFLPIKEDDEEVLASACFLDEMEALEAEYDRTS